MPQLDITTGVQTVTTAGAVTGSLDTSALTGDWTLLLQITGLASGKKARIAVEDTAHATPFSEAQQVAVLDLVGPYDTVTPVSLALRKFNLGAIRFGAANTKLRVNVLAVDASPALKVYACLDNKA